MTVKDSGIGIGLAACMLAGCNTPDRCEDFPKNLSEMPVRMWELPKADSEILPVPAKLLIESCYPKADYSYPGHPMIEEGVRAYGQDKLIVSYEHEGVSDTRVAFVVNRSGQITSVFQYGM